MSQSFYNIGPTDLVSDSRGSINSNFETLRSNFEGINFPPTPVKGQIAYINAQLYLYDGSTWVKVWTEDTDGTNSGLNADAIDGYEPGNASGNIPINNGTLNTNLNADKVDGYEPGNALGKISINNGTLNTNLNADLLDGKHAGNNSGNIPINNGLVNTDLNASLLQGHIPSTTPTAGVIPVADTNGKLNAWVDQGAGSGLNAETLDGHDSTYFANAIAKGSTADPNNTQQAYILTAHSNSPQSGTYWHIQTLFYDNLTGNRAQIAVRYNGGTDEMYIRSYYSSSGWTSWKRVWHAGNDGSGSGLDADKLDGHDSSYFLTTSTYTASDVLTKIKTVDGVGSGLDADTLDGQHSSYFLPASSYTASDILTKVKTVDGSGSGLDADKWEGGDKYISTSDASGSAAEGSVWFKY